MDGNIKKKKKGNDDYKKTHYHNLDTVKVAKHWNGQAGEYVKFVLGDIKNLTGQGPVQAHCS